MVVFNLNRLTNSTAFFDLQKKAEKLELAAEEHSDSQLLMLGQKALKRMNSSNSQEPKVAATVDPLASPNPKQPYKILVRTSYRVLYSVD